MVARSGKLFTPSLTPVAVALLALSLLVFAADFAWPQTSPSRPALGLQEQGQSPTPQAEPASQPPPEREENPGLFNEMGKLFKKSLSILPPLKSPGEAVGDPNAHATDAAKNAGNTFPSLIRPASMVSGRMICPVAANGSPDCKQGADRLCQSKGYKEGKSLNTDSAQTCSAKVLIPGRARKPDDCRTDNYVTSALCQ